MKFRHTAALALAGWSLMLPPIDYGNATVVSSAPLREWEVHQIFDTAKECTEFRASYIRDIAALNMQRVDPEEDALRDRESRWQSGTTAKNRKNSLDRAREGLCIAADDPRLKEKLK